MRRIPRLFPLWLSVTLSIAAVFTVPCAPALTRPQDYIDQVNSMKEYDQSTMYDKYLADAIAAEYYR